MDIFLKTLDTSFTVLNFIIKGKEVIDTAVDIHDTIKTANEQNHPLTNTEKVDLLAKGFFVGITVLEAGVGCTKYRYKNDVEAFEKMELLYKRCHCASNLAQDASTVTSLVRFNAKDDDVTVMVAAAMMTVALDALLLRNTTTNSLTPTQVNRISRMRGSLSTLPKIYQFAARHLFQSSPSPSNASPIPSFQNNTNIPTMSSIIPVEPTTEEISEELLKRSAIWDLLSLEFHEGIPKEFHANARLGLILCSITGLPTRHPVKLVGNESIYYERDEVEILIQAGLEIPDDTKPTGTRNWKDIIPCVDLQRIIDNELSKIRSELAEISKTLIVNLLSSKSFTCPISQKTVTHPAALKRNSTVYEYDRLVSWIQKFPGCPIPGDQNNNSNLNRVLDEIVDLQAL